MFTFNNHIKDKQVIQADAKQKQEFKRIGSMRLVPGLIVWKYNTKTEVLDEVDIQKELVYNADERRGEKKAKALHDPNCWYFQTHNMKAAVKKLNKMINRIKGISDYYVIVKKEMVINPKYENGHN